MARTGVTSGTRSVAPAQRAAAIDRELRAAADPARRQATLSYYPSAMENLGTRVPAQRVIVRALRPQLRQESAAAVLALVRALIAQKTLEGRQVGYELLAGHAVAMAALDRPTIEALGKGIDNWASVDCFGCCVTGVAWRLGRLPDRAVHAWAKNEDPWWRRLALVSTVPLNVKSRGGRGDPVRTLRVCTMLACDEHPMVHKALSWALREVIAWDRAAVVAFLAAHPTLPARVRREVATKLVTGRKAAPRVGGGLTADNRGGGS